jgi:hypothetical protein
VVVTKRDANGAIESVSEYGDRQILSARETRGKAARAALTRRVARWKGASAESLWSAFRE